ncbi:NAD(+) diphosphatase [Herbiconiux sp. CPCC 205763]|uniref:NAD(+) diphosphatase n=1 Tax=Herbiconiux aconitum TaxID=2970913 RepID=A0ABT2GS87_9MICO|nr:NAD(+) diphosphatase [Herbiconiux aconitum]MCS5719096.1 NAD(+) diphosphatase [Herbiconiux aconitum]
MSRAFQSLLPLSRNRIDRDHLSRSNPELLDERWRGPDSRVLVLHRGQALATAGANPADYDGFGPKPTVAVHPTLDLRSPADLPASVLQHLDAGGVRLYLGFALDASEGLSIDAPLFAISVTDADASALETPGSSWLNLRMVAADLDDVSAGMFTEALAMFNWHSTHTHCPRCGEVTVVESGGWVRRCPREDIELFPRTDPAIIVGVVDRDDRILLGSNALWENNRYSLLAGFVEPGESLEAAAIREIAEESGVIIDDPEYVGSQPWPFPASLMVGFMARVTEEHPAALRPDGDEILDLRWFTREQLADPASGVLLPGSSSIARAIIERWYGGPLPEPEQQ